MPDKFMGLAKTFRDELERKLREYINTPLPDFEIVAIICDPRIKFTFFDDISEYADDKHYWLGLKEKAKQILIDGITKSILHDRERVDTETSSAPETVAVDKPATGAVPTTEAAKHS